MLVTFKVLRAELGGVIGDMPSELKRDHISKRVNVLDSYCKMTNAITAGYALLALPPVGCVATGKYGRSMCLWRIRC